MHANEAEATQTVFAGSPRILGLSVVFQEETHHGFVHLEKPRGKI